MPSRSLIHLFLSIPTLVGIGVVFFLLARAGVSDVSDEPASVHVIEAWGAIFSEIPAEMPSVFPEYNEDVQEPESAEDLSEEEKIAYARSNALIFSCSVFVLLGVIGISLMGLSSASHEPFWHGLLRTGTLFAVTLTSFILLGFNLAFPGDETAIFPIPSFYLPGEIDSVEYGLNGITEWCDLLFIATYSLFFAALILSLAYASMRSSPLFLIAIPAATIFFPIVVSWKWGGGWLDQLLNNYDFAGAALLHWHAGIAILLISLVATMTARSKKLETESNEGVISPTGIALYLVGGFAYLLALLAINVGSCLEATPEVCAPVMQVTLIAAGISGIFGLVWASLSEGKPFLSYFIAGAAGGMIAVSAATDATDLNSSITCGVVAGIFIPGSLFLLRKIGWIDPLNLGVVHGVGGLISMLCATFIAEDTTLVGQFAMLFTVPILTLMGTVLVVLIASVSGLLLLSGKAKDPPPLPKASE